MFKNFKFHLFLFICLPFYLNGQTSILDNCGIDDQRILTKKESDFLNEYFKDSRDTFDFTSKQIIFVTGSAGKTISTKKAYFSSIKSYQQRHSRIATCLVPFSEKEKISSGGYDAIVGFWTKATPKSKKLIRKIRKKNRYSL